MISTWLYISLCATPPDEARNAVTAIVEVSRARNEAAGVTGALIWTGRHFAQYLEGPASGLAAVQASIGRDPRHTDIHTLEQSTRRTRLFDGWSLAYAGVATYFDRQLARIAAQAVKSGVPSAQELKYLLTELQRGGGLN